MASEMVGQQSNVGVAREENARYLLPLALMVSLYFVIGFITSLNDILIPHFKDLFHLKNVEALLVQFCFFGAYFVMSLPCGWIVGKIGYKTSIALALSIMGIGLLLFLPASMIIFYPLFLFALFVVGSGLALLQVAINPYVGALGPPDTAASRLNLCGGLNSLATTIAPRIGASFIFVGAAATTVELAQSVRMPYVILAAGAFVMAGITALVHLPRLIETKTGNSKVEGSAWKVSHLRLGAIAIFCYVGAEVAIGSIMINFLGQPSMGSLSHLEAAHYVSYYWGSAMIGRFIGFVVMQKIKAEKGLAFVALMALLFVGTGIIAHGGLAVWAIVLCGLFNSIMWPCIFPLSVKNLGPLTSQGSGILVTMVVGGAVIPEIQAYLADQFGYQPSFSVILLCYAYILFFAVKGYRDLRPAKA
jgi:MFS transporter, FHS family, L-fucose permease